MCGTELSNANTIYSSSSDNAIDYNDIQRDVVGVHCSVEAEEIGRHFDKRRFIWNINFYNGGNNNCYQIVASFNVVFFSFETRLVTCTHFRLMESFAC